MMFTTRDTKGHTQTCLTLIFKVNHQDQVTDFGFSEILDFENVRIDVKNQVCSMYTAGAKKGHTMNVCDLEFQGQPSRSRDFFNIFDILDLKNVRIDTKIDFILCLQPEIRKSRKKVFDLDFQDHAIKIEFFSLSPLDSLTPKTYPWEIFSKIRTGRQKSRGGGTHPLGRPKVDFYLGHLRVKSLLSIVTW